MNLRPLCLVLAMALGGCAATYSLVSRGPTQVAKKAFTVQPESAWNRVPKQTGMTAWEEAWTKNGPVLDTIASVGGLPDGRAPVKQNRKADRKVPEFQANRSPQDLVSMIESSYRVGGVTHFTVDSVEPTEFLAHSAVRMNYSYVASDSLPRKGRCVMSIVNGELFLMKLEGAASRYFAAALREFDAMVSSARVGSTA